MNLLSDLHKLIKTCNNRCKMKFERDSNEEVGEFQVIHQ